MFTVCGVLGYDQRLSLWRRRSQTKGRGESSEELATTIAEPGAADQGHREEDPWCSSASPSAILPRETDHEPPNPTEDLVLDQREDMRSNASARTRSGSEHYYPIQTL